LLAAYGRQSRRVGADLGRVWPNDVNRRRGVNAHRFDEVRAQLRPQIVGARRDGNAAGRQFQRGGNPQVEVGRVEGAVRQTRPKADVVVVLTVEVGIEPGNERVCGGGIDIKDDVSPDIRALRHDEVLDAAPRCAELHGRHRNADLNELLSRARHAGGARDGQRHAINSGVREGVWRRRHRLPCAVAEVPQVLQHIARLGIRVKRLRRVEAELRRGGIRHLPVHEQDRDGAVYHGDRGCLRGLCALVIGECQRDGKRSVRPERMAGRNVQARTAVAEVPGSVDDGAVIGAVRRVELHDVRCDSVGGIGNHRDDDRRRQVEQPTASAGSRPRKAPGQIQRQKGTDDSQTGQDEATRSAHSTLLGKRRNTTSSDKYGGEEESHQERRGRIVRKPRAGRESERTHETWTSCGILAGGVANGAAGRRLPQRRLRRRYQRHGKHRDRLNDVGDLDYGFERVVHEQLQRLYGAGDGGCVAG